MFPETLDGAKVLYYTTHDDFGVIYWDNGEIASCIKYLAICKYSNKNNEFYIFCCDEEYEVVGDSLWESIEMCMGAANSLRGEQVVWIEKK